MDSASRSEEWKESVLYQSVLPADNRIPGHPLQVIGDNCILATLDSIEQNLSAPWSLGALAQAVGLNPFQLNRRFKKTMGETVGDYLRRTRLDMAAIMICRTQTPILETALLMGYNSQAAFSRAFIRQFGLPPKKAWSAAMERLPQPQAEHHTLARAVRAGWRDAVPLIAMRCHGPYQEVPQFWHRFSGHLRQHGIDPGATKPVGILYDDPGITPSHRIRYDCCIIEQTGSGRTLTAPLRRQQLRPAEYAALDVEGHYAEIAKAIFSMCAVWMPAQRRMLDSAAAYEIYRQAPWEDQWVKATVLVPLVS